MFVLWLSLGLATAADADGDGFESIEDGGTDCDDNDPTVNPGATEVCEPGVQVDTDCDGNPNTHQGAYHRQPGDAPANVAVRSLFADLDNDGYGDEGDTDPIYVCRITETEDFYAENAMDCDDGNPNRHPTAVEVCNDADDNCNFLIDEPTPDTPPGTETLYVDLDGDGYGSEASGSAEFCASYVTALQVRSDGEMWYESDEPIEHEGLWDSELGDDCNDGQPEMHPRDGDYLEAVDGLDGDCDGMVLVGELDCDRDGAFVPSAAVGDTASALPAFQCGRWTLQPQWSDNGQAVVPWQSAAQLFDEGVRLLDGDCLGGVDCEDSDSGRNSCSAEICDGHDTDCSGADAGADADGDGIPDSLQGGVPGATTEQLFDINDDGIADACDTFGPEVRVVGSGESLPPPPPSEEDDEDDAQEDDDEENDDEENDDTRSGSACSTGSSPGPVAFLLLPLALLVRRTRR